MWRKIIVYLVFVALCLGAAVWLSGPDREETARKGFEAAQKFEQDRDFDQAVALYNRLIAEMPGTDVADRARLRVQRIDRLKDTLLVQDARETLDRIVLVLDGYRDMLGRLPESVRDLDRDDYMFDSDYVAQIPQPGSLCYVRFEPANASYTLFFIGEGSDRAVRLDGSGNVSILKSDDIGSEINMPGFARIDKGRVVFLQPQG